MEVQILRRPAASCLLSSATHGMLSILRAGSSSSSSTPITVHLSARRHQSSTRRTKKALNIRPHPSFLQEAPDNQIIFNPPASEPSVYHTPFKFLPKSDPRRQANLPSLFETQSAARLAAADVPPVRQHDLQPKNYTLTEQDVAEMRRLRIEDPVKNSVPALAHKFKCTKLFVMMCCAVVTPRAHKAAHYAQVAAQRDRWGPRKAAAKADKYKRLEMLFNGDL